MRYFDATNRVNQDRCALETRDRENESVANYNTYNFYHADGTCTDVEKKVKDLATEYPNLTFRVGYGVASACSIEQDNKVRYGFDMTHGPERQNLCTRNFVAGPNFSRGTLIPNLESVLLNGVDTLVDRDCYKIAETQLGVFQPMSACVADYVKKASDVIVDDIRIGKPSKDIFMSERKQICQTK